VVEENAGATSMETGPDSATPTEEEASDDEESGLVHARDGPSFQELAEEDEMVRRASSVAREESLAHVLEDIPSPRQMTGVDTPSLPPSSPSAMVVDEPLRLPSPTPTPELPTLSLDNSPQTRRPHSVLTLGGALAQSTPIVTQPPRYQGRPLSTQQAQADDEIEDDGRRTLSHMDIDPIVEELPKNSTGQPPLSDANIGREELTVVCVELVDGPVEETRPPSNPMNASDQKIDIKDAHSVQNELEEDTEITPAPAKAKPMVTTDDVFVESDPPASQPAARKRPGRPRLPETEVKRRAEEKEKAKAEKAEAKARAKQEKEDARKRTTGPRGSQKALILSVLDADAEMDDDTAPSARLESASSPQPQQSIAEWATLDTQSVMADAEPSMDDQLRSSSPQEGNILTMSSPPKDVSPEKALPSPPRSEPTSPMAGKKTPEKSPPDTALVIDSHNFSTSLASKQDDPVIKQQGNPESTAKAIQTPRKSVAPLSLQESCEDLNPIQRTPLFLPSESQLSYPYTQGKTPQPSPVVSQNKEDDLSDKDVSDVVKPTVKRPPIRPASAPFRRMTEIFSQRGSLFSSPLLRVANMTASQPTNMPSRAKKLGTVKVKSDDDDENDDSSSSDDSTGSTAGNRSHIPKGRRASLPAKRRKSGLLSAFT
jgi:hypothetical protein